MNANEPLLTDPMSREEMLAIVTLLRGLDRDALIGVAFSLAGSFARHLIKGNDWPNALTNEQGRAALRLLDAAMRATEEATDLHVFTA